MKPFNILITYQGCLEHTSFFLRILQYIEGNEILKNSRICPIKIYETYFNQYFKEEQTKKNFNSKNFDIISLENLQANQLVFFGDKLDNFDTLVFAEHFLEIFKNIHNMSKPLTLTEYNEFVILIKEKKYYFQDLNFQNKVTKDIEEVIFATEKILQKVEESIISSINTLKYKQENIIKEINDYQKDNVNSKKKKLNLVKELFQRNIMPLYTFTNDKHSEFMKELDALRNAINFYIHNNRMYIFKRKIDFYFKQYIIHSKDIKPIHKFINHYIQKNEQELLYSLGIERTYTELLEMFDSFDVENNKTNKKYIHTSKHLTNINKFFKNLCYTTKDSNIKTHVINHNTCNKFNIFLNETQKYLEVKKIQKMYIIEEAEKLKIIMKDDLNRKQKNENIKQNFVQNFERKLIQPNQYIMKELIGFLNSNYENTWEVGHLTYLLSYILKKYSISHFQYLKENTIRNININHKLFTYKEIIFKGQK